MRLPERQVGPFAVSALGLGCMNLSHAYGVPPSEAEAFALINHALDLGVSFLDTAALYGGGANERLIRRVAHRRGEFVLASKCGLTIEDGKRVLDGSPEAIGRTLDASLTRLGVDHIDLYYLHRLDQRVPIEESMGALVRAKEAGKIGAIGLSEVSAATIQRAHVVYPIAAVQSEYSPAVRNPEVAVVEACRRLGIGLVAFSPLARGLLADAVREDRYVSGDIRNAMPRFVEPQLSRNLLVVAKFNTIARGAGITPAQLALAWLLTRASFVVPIPGTRSIAHLEENLAAATLALTADVLTAVDILMVPNALTGARYRAEAQAQIDTELLVGEEIIHGAD